MVERSVLEREILEFALALVLLAISGSIARFARVPLLLGYLAAGLLAQPFLRPSPSLFLLSSIGVMLLFFFLGMEFDWRRLLASPRRLFITLVDLVFNFAVPFILLSVLGLSYPAAFFVAMAFYPTSSVVTISALHQLRRLANPETETIVWLLVGEDLAVVALLVIASGLTGEEIGVTGIVAASAFVGTMLFASVVLTRPLEWVFERLPAELDNLVSLSVIVLLSAVAYMFRLSEVLGAFLAGLIFSGTRDRQELEQRLHVLRELGASFFFFTFGLQTPLRISLSGALLGFVVLVFSVITKVATAWAIGLIEGLRRRARSRLLFSLWARGEFSVIAILMGRKVLPPVWQEIMGWFVVATIIVGLVAISLAGKFAERT